MFRLVIADDEARIREGFSRIVDWTRLGFRLVGCYADGRQVLEHLEKEHVDVVLTDIRMTHISGLEVAKTIREKYPNTVCVLVSAYQEFDFAHQAIAFGVKDYLFKPTRIADIRKVFTGIAHTLERESELMEQDDRRRRRYEEMSELWRTQFLYDLYMGTLQSEDTLLAQAAKYNPTPSNLVVFLHRYALPSGEAIQAEAQDVLRRTFRGEKDGCDIMSVLVEMDGMEIVAVMDKTLLTEKDIDFQLEEMCQQAADMVGISLQKVSVERFDTLIAFAHRPRKRFLQDAAGGSMALNRESSEMFLSQQRLLLSYLSAGSIEQARTLAKEMVCQLENLPDSMIKSLVVDTAARLQTRLQAMALVKPSLPEYSTLLTAANMADVIGWFWHQIDVWSRQFPQIHTPKTVIESVKQFVRERYASAISLESAAEAVFLSPVYLSRLFKQETGENFSDYLGIVRFEKAKELLIKSNIRVYDVGQRTGYMNPRYFYRVFKQMSGYTPSEYRRQYAREENACDGE